jgi:hypothetical protein
MNQQNFQAARRAAVQQGSGGLFHSISTQLADFNIRLCNCQSRRVVVAPVWAG